MTDAASAPLAITRRQAVAGVAALSLLGTAAAAQEAMARGTVHEEGGGSLPGVLVSNGRDVVATDGDGRWNLPVRPGDALFVIKPTGWMTPVAPDTQLPRFSYVHDPDGTPADLAFRFAGMPATGPLPDSIDFTLRRQEEKTSFQAILMTDPQPESLAELGFVRDGVVAALHGYEAAFGITHGDLMFDDLANYDRYNRILGAVGLPWYNVPGNHDMNFEAPDNVRSRDTYKRVFGARTAAFQYGGATFFLLDNVEYLGSDPARPNGGGKYQGRFGPEQLGFVRNVLAHVPRDALVVLSFHIPLRTLAGTEPGVATTDTAEFLAAIATHPNAVSFSGHTHTNEHWYLEQAGGAAHHHHVLSAASGSWWSGPLDERGIPVALATDGTPNGFHILSVEPLSVGPLSVERARCRTTLVPARCFDQTALRIVLDSQMHRADPELLAAYPPGALLAGPIAQSAAGSTRVIANLFDGGPRSQVSLTIGRDGPRLPMARVTRRDPFVEEVYGRNPRARKPWVKPELSSHLFQAALPTQLGTGTHRLTVEAVDEHGRSHDASMILEILA